MSIEDSITAIRNEIQQDLAQAQSLKDIEALKIKYLGKKGPLQHLMSFLKDVSSEQRPIVGKLINDLKIEITEHLEKVGSDFLNKEQTSQLLQESIDISLPGRKNFLGRKHVAVQMLDEVIEILIGMGFTVQYGPDIESDYYNFEALNFSKDHPARDMQDTFYISQDLLLRTHTSNTQVRVMEVSKPPIRVIMPGKCYRNEDVTARSHVVFHQVEGLYIDRGVTFSDLLKTMEEFFSKLFKQEVTTRFRPSYFPFVEPGMEVDIGCIACQGNGCIVCKHTGWLEVAGAGMVHPEVLKNGGIDPEVYSGYAWGMGPDRLAMLRHGINDIRLFMENNLRFLQQF